MTITVLKNKNGRQAIVLEGTDCNLRTKLSFGDVEFDKEAIKTLKATIYDQKTEDIIGNWDELPVLDQNGCTLSDEGELTVRIRKADNVVLADIPPDRLEDHVIEVTATFDDFALQDRESTVDFKYSVRKRRTPQTPTP